MYVSPIFVMEHDRKKESLLEHLEHNNYNAKYITKSSKKRNTNYD